MLGSVLICSFINCHFIFTHSVIDAKLTPFTENENLTEIHVLTNTENFSKSKTLTQKNDQIQFEEICIDTIWHTFYEKYWFYIDASIYSFIPSILLTIFNISIIRYLFKAADESLKLKEMHKRKKYPDHSKSFNTSQSYGSLVKTNSIRSNNNFLTNYINEISHADNYKRGSAGTNKTRFDSPKESVDIACLNKTNLIITKIYENDDHYDTSPMTFKGKIPIFTRRATRINSCRKFNTRITVMLIALNITFCIFSMPMVILQIIYYSFYPFLEATSYYVYSPSHAGLETTTVYKSTSMSAVLMNSSPKLTVSDIPVDEQLLARIDLLKAVAELLQYLNHSTNFFCIRLVERHSGMRQRLSYVIILILFRFCLERGGFKCVLVIAVGVAVVVMRDKSRILDTRSNQLFRDFNSVIRCLGIHIHVRFKHHVFIL